MSKTVPIKAEKGKPENKHIIGHEGLKPLVLAIVIVIVRKAR